MSDRPRTTRRRFLQAAAGLAALPGAGLASHQAAEVSADTPPALAKLLRKADLPEPKGPRVVIVGGGWSGLSLAKYLMLQNPAFDVVLVDRQSAFLSFPLSNAWLADQVTMEFLSHSFFEAANRHGYRFLQAAVLGFDRDARKVYTDAGIIGYDYLVLAPGIEYDYPRIGVEDPVVQELLYHRYPGGFFSSSELLTIKRKIHEFRRGTFLLTVPSGDYRCSAAPYERACVMAALFRRNRVRGKVLLLDMNNEITIMKDAFERAFGEVYRDVIEYLPSSLISGVDLEKRVVETEFDEYAFDDAIIYPPIRASRLLEEGGIVDPASTQKTARTDPFRYHLVGDERVYVTGDARSQPFSKGGHTANSEAQYVAEVIAGHALGREVEWRSPQTMCFSAVEIDPLRAMSHITYYRYDKTSGDFAFDRIHSVERWDVTGGLASIAWAEGMFQDMFYE